MKSQNPQSHGSLYKSLFDNMPDGLAYCQMIFDKQGYPIDFVYIEVNKNFEKQMGLQEVIGKKATELIPGVRTSNPELFEIYGRVSLTCKSEKFETYVGPLSRWFLVSVYCPKKKFFVAVFQDITERRQIEKDLENSKIAARNVLEDLQVERDKLAEAKAKNDALLESVGEGVVATDKDGKVILINRAAEGLLGFTSREILGKFFVQAVSLYNAESNRVLDEFRPISLALSSGTTTTTTTTTTYYFVRRDGIKFPVAIIVAPVTTNNSKTAGAIMVFRDISKEKEIEKLHMDFLSLASHQLRTPLSGIKWLIETMNRGVIGTLNPRQKEYLEQIYNINERMIKLVFEILSVLRLEGGTGGIKKETVSVLELFDHLSKMMDAAAKKREILLNNTFKDRGEKLVVETDAIMLKTILECFVSNAIDYSNTGQEVILGAESEPNAVLFFVRNFGPLIQKDEQKRIFERFYRSSEAKMIKPRGTGLGLYTASMLAKKIEATVFFESEEGKGTTFYARVPKQMVDRNNNQIPKNL